MSCLYSPLRRAGVRLALSWRRSDGTGGRSEVGFGQLKAHVGSVRFASLAITPTAIRRSGRSHRLLREILSCSTSAWLIETAVAWLQPPSKGEVAHLVEEPALQRPETAVIKLDGIRQIFSAGTYRRCCSRNQREVMRISLSPSPPSTPSCPAPGWH